MKQLVKVVAGTILVLREQFLVLREQCFCNILLEIWFTKVNYFSVYIECTIAMNLSLICLHFKQLTYISLVKVNHLHILTRFCHSCVNAFSKKIFIFFQSVFFAKGFPFLLVFESECVTLTSVHH